MLRDGFNTASGNSPQVNCDDGMNTSFFFKGSPALCSFSRQWTSCQLEKSWKARLDVANEHVLWTDDDWLHVCFSGESKFNVVGFDAGQCRRYRRGERFLPKRMKKSMKCGGGGSIFCPHSTRAMRNQVRFSQEHSTPSGTEIEPTIVSAVP